MSRFDPESYLRYRVEYPVALFSPLASFVCGRAGSFHLLDLGAGTGLSSSSFLKFYPEVTAMSLIDPDPAMLDAASRSSALQSRSISLVVAPGSEFRVGDQADLVLVGSAWHWMSTCHTMDSILRALKPGGALFVFEYQFPKAREEGAGAKINEWIRRAFNSTWKEVGQKPRGALPELLRGFFDHPEFSFRGEAKVEQEVALTLEDLFGLILSQSRYLAFERRLEPEQVQAARAQVFHDLRQIWGQNQDIPFTYRFHGIRFQVRNV